MWMTGREGMTVKEAALLLIQEARNYIQRELGISLWPSDIRRDITASSGIESCEHSFTKSPKKEEHREVGTVEENKSFHNESKVRKFSDDVFGSQETNGMQETVNQSDRSPVTDEKACVNDNESQQIRDNNVEERYTESILFVKNDLTVNIRKDASSTKLASSSAEHEKKTSFVHLNFFSDKAQESVTRNERSADNNSSAAKPKNESNEVNLEGDISVKNCTYESQTLNFSESKMEFLLKLQQSVRDAGCHPTQSKNETANQVKEDGPNAYNIKKNSFKFNSDCVHKINESSTGSIGIFEDYSSGNISDTRCDFLADLSNFGIGHAEKLLSSNHKVRDCTVDKENVPEIKKGNSLDEMISKREEYSDMFDIGNSLLQEFEINMKEQLNCNGKQTDFKFPSLNISVSKLNQLSNLNCKEIDKNLDVKGMISDVEEKNGNVGINEDSLKIKMKLTGRKRNASGSPDNFDVKRKRSLEERIEGKEDKIEKETCRSPNLFDDSFSMNSQLIGELDKGIKEESLRKGELKHEISFKFMDIDVEEFCNTLNEEKLKELNETKHEEKDFSGRGFFDDINFESTCFRCSTPTINNIKSAGSVSKQIKSVSEDKNLDLQSKTKGLGSNLFTLCDKKNSSDSDSEILVGSTPEQQVSSMAAKKSRVPYKRSVNVPEIHCIGPQNNDKNNEIHKDVLEDSIIFSTPNVLSNSVLDKCITSQSDFVPKSSRNASLVVPSAPQGKQSSGGEDVVGPSQNRPRKRERRKKLKCVSRKLDLESGTSKLRKEEKFNIIDVCASKNVFSTFSSEVKLYSDISLAIAYEKVNENKDRRGRVDIGMQIISGRKKNLDKLENLQEYVYENKKIIGVAICCGHRDVFYVDLSYDKEVNCIPHEDRLNLLKDVISKEYIWQFDAKGTFKAFLKGLGIQILATPLDPKIADWLLEPQEKEENFENLVKKYLGDLYQSIRKKSNSDGCKSLSCREAFLTWRLMEIQLRQLCENKMEKHFKEVEMPIEICLVKMEINGVGYNLQVAQKIWENLSNEKKLLEKKAYRLAGHTFSIKSAKEVSKVLYKELGLRPQGGTDSTSKAVLRRLQSQHQIVNAIIEWRKINHIMTKITTISHN